MWIGLADAVGRRLGDADFLLDPLGRRFADQQIVVAADVGDDRLVHLVAADAHRGGVGEAAQRQHRDFGRAAADIDDHRCRSARSPACRRRSRPPSAPRSARPAGAGIGRGVADRAALDARSSPTARRSRSRASARSGVLPPCTLWMKCLIICSATSMSAITPSRSGRIASIWSGVLPIISLASSPTALTLLTPLIVSIATTDGSLSTMPRPRT